MEEMTKEEREEAVEQLVVSIGMAIHGHMIGHIIPALIYTLAELHDESVMSKEEFLKNVTEDLSEWIDRHQVRALEEEKENTQWLQ